MDQFIQIIKEFGPWVATALFLIWQTWKREERMAKALDRQHDQFVEILARVTAAIEQSTSTQKTLVRVLNERPCISDEETQVVYPPSHQERHGQKRHRTPLPATEALERSA